MDAPPIVLDPPARERSTYPIRLTPLDEDGQPATLTGLSWTLSRLDGAIINERFAVALENLTTPVVLLVGPDLAVDDEEGSNLVLRRVTFVGTYTSDLGTDLPLAEEVYVPIKPLRKVP